MSKLKTVQDYYERMYELYPTIPKSDIKRILQYGWKLLYLYNSFGGDTLIRRKDFWFYCGKLMNDSVKWFEYYKHKMCRKLRLMYIKKKIEWDGFYYFALSQNEYEEYLKQKNKKGRPRKKFTFTNKVLYKIYDECNISESGKVAIFKIPTPIKYGDTFYKEKLVTDNAELILLRNPLKLEDILLSVYNYKFISDRKREYKINNNE